MFFTLNINTTKGLKNPSFWRKKLQDARYRCGESAIMTEGLKLTIFSYKWGKCVKLVGK